MNVELSSSYDDTRYWRRCAWRYQCRGEDKDVLRVAENVSL